MVFFNALATYLTAWLSAFTPRGRSFAPLTPRRLVFLLLVPAGLFLLLVHWLALALDHLLFPGFRRLLVRDAVFVLGVPRSGTTYLHRKLARSPGFTTTQTWEVLLAPSICERRLLKSLGAIDDRIGGWGGKALRYLMARLASDLQEIHEVSLDAAEEDYLSLLAGAGCFFVYLAFPHSARLRALGRLDALPAASRERLLNHYHRLLQRHLYAHGGGRLLSKNAAFASWMPYLAQRYPDASFLVCVRRPATALSSQLSSLAGACRSFASFHKDADLSREFAAFYEHWYRVLDESVHEFGERCTVVEQSVLRSSEAAVLSDLYRRLNIPATADERFPVKDRMAASSAHKHDLASWPMESEALAAMESSYGSLLAKTHHGDHLLELAL